MRIVFLGNNRLGWKIAEYLSEKKENIVCLVLNAPEKRKCGRNIRECLNIDDHVIFEADDLSKPSVNQAIAELKPDLALSVLFGAILKEQFINLFPLGVINIHPSYLPYNRGAHPNVWSIVDGTPAGTTIHFIDEGVDTGDIIARKQIPVEPFDTGKSLYDKLEFESLELFKENWPKIKSGNIERIKQRGKRGSFHFAKELEQIDEIYLEKTYRAHNLINILRARTFSTYPGAFIRYKGQKIYLKLELIPEKNPEGE